jgi:hypothetical protein
MEKMRYVVVCWPDSQALMEKPWFDECELINTESGVAKHGSSAYLVPEERFAEL